MADTENTIQETVTEPVVPRGQRVSYKSEAQSRERPFNAFRFLVYIGQDETVKGAFSGFSGIRMSTRMVKARTGEDSRGVQDNFPGITEYEPVTLTKGVIGDSEFLKWVENANAPGWDSAPVGLDKYRDLRIVALNDQGQPGMIWSLKNATPSGYQLKEMDASASAILTESIEFSITGVKRAFVADGANKDTVYKTTDRIIRTYEGAPGTSQQKLVAREEKTYDPAAEEAARKKKAAEEQKAAEEKEAQELKEAQEQQT